MSAEAPTSALRTLNDIILLIAGREYRETLRHKRAGAWVSIEAGEMFRQVVWVARGLERLGVVPGDRVALLSENRAEWAVADFSILGRGAVTVPIYPTLPAASCEYILQDSGACGIVVSNKAHLEKIRSVWDRLPQLRFAVAMEGVPVSAAPFRPFSDDANEKRQLAWRDLVGDAQLPSAERVRFEVQARAVGPEQLASIIYTSGTTGTPKGVMLTHANIVSNVLASADLFQPDDLALSFLPLSHIYERMVDYTYLYNAVPIAYAESIEAVAQNLVEVHPTVLAAVPRFFEKMHARVMDAIRQAPAPRRWLFWWAVGVGREVLRRRATEQKLPTGLALRHALAERLVFHRLRARLGGRIRFFLSGSAPLSPALSEFFNAAGVEVCEGYGLTETSPVVATNVPGRNRPGTVGKPVAGVEVRIAEDGEILVRGPNLMKGYYNQPEETAQVLKDGWFHTGDIGELTAGGELRVTDRKKDLLKTAGGKYVAPQPIENRLRACPYLLNAVLVGDRRPYVVALLVPNFDRLAEFARQRSLPCSSPAELARHEQVRALLQQQVDAVNAELAPFEQIKRFVVLERDFSMESGELTPTMKVRRRVVEQHYRDAVESLYGKT